MAKYVLRDLPGVAEIEARCKRIAAHPNPEWAPEKDGYASAVDAVSRRLFGLTEAETSYETDEALTAEEDQVAFDRWEENFEFVYSDDDAAAALLWDALGWDTKDADGEDLACLHDFSLQMVCATKGLKGRLPGAPLSEAQAAEEASLWAQRISQEALTFQKRRRG